MTVANNMTQQEVWINWQSSEGTCQCRQEKAALGILKEMIASKCCLSSSRVEIFTHGISGKYNLHSTHKPFRGRSSAQGPHRHVVHEALWCTS